jgi:DNA-binding NarL/FixJ family response regulator
MPDRFVVISRRVAADEDAEELTSVPVDVVESDVADLGPLEALTPREVEVLALIGQGLSMKETAHVLRRSVKTVDNHRMSIGKKLDVHDRVKLAEIARRAGLTLRDAERVRV